MRRALREAAAQSAQIGVAEADFYPQIGVTGFIGYAASDIRHLFASNSLTGLILPNFSWKILNYGRVLNNVRNQDAHFRELILQYQQTVLQAGREVEDALVAYLQYQLQARSLEVGVKEADDSVVLVQAQYRVGLVDFNRVFTAQSQLVGLQDQLANVPRQHRRQSRRRVSRSGWRLASPGEGRARWSHESCDTRQGALAQSRRDACRSLCLSVRCGRLITGVSWLSRLSAGGRIICVSERYVGSQPSRRAGSGVGIP